MSKIQNIFIKDNLQDRRKILSDFCEQSPMFDVEVNKLNKRHIELEDGHWLADFSTQDYLGLDFDERVIAAANKANSDFGTVSAWCRLVATVSPFIEVEKEVAKLVGTQSASVFASTTLLNHGVIPALLGNDGVMFLDKSSHATMYEGAKIARDSGAKLVSYKQDDFEELEKLLIENKDIKKKLIAVDGVYSMTGEYADLPKLDSLAKKYDALLYVDDAHGFGVVGENPSKDYPYGHKGNGIVNYYGLDFDNILYIGCFSKAYGSYGAFICCSEELRQFLISQATPHDLGGHGPASSMAANLKGFEINNEEGDEIRKKLYSLTNKTETGLKKLGFKLARKTEFPIISIWLGSSEHMIEVSKILFDNHILLTLSPYPMVKKGDEALRITVTPTNTQKEIDQLLLAFDKVKKYLVKKESFVQGKKI